MNDSTEDETKVTLATDMGSIGGIDRLGRMKMPMALKILVDA